MGLSIQQIDTRRDDVASALHELREKLSPRGNVVSPAGRQLTVEVFGEPLAPQQVVERICRDVRDNGLPALLRYCEQLDKKQLDASSLRVSRQELEQAHARADQGFLGAIRTIRSNIAEFQQAILHHDVRVRRGDGAELRQRYRALERVGVCVPGGAAAYPSSVLMTVVPAQVAGVKQIAVVAPPTDFGANNPDVLATCCELGVEEVYRLGGAQGVASLAYGVEGVHPVDKVVGPGNLFVALAKQFVFGHVDIDSIAGPSEVVVLADDETRPDFAAADLLAQAEHAPGASILITWDAGVLAATRQQLEQQVARLSRSDVTVQSLESFGALILVSDPDEAIEITNQIAPEHLHIATRDAEQLAEKLPTAGAIFLGNFSPVALGDYAAGPSHVLPTGGTGRWASGLSANDFMRSHSVIHYSEEALRGIASVVQTMATKEGLTAHRASVDIRVTKERDS